MPRLRMFRLFRLPSLVLLAALLLVANAFSGAPRAAAATTQPGAFVALAPSRLLDTRTGVGAVGPVAAGGTVSLQVSGRGGVPSSGASAVVLNVTVTEPTLYGFVTAYPSGTSAPNASTVNFNAGQTLPNLTVVKLGSDGKVNLTMTGYGTVQLVADVSGYFLAGSASEAGAFVPVNPSRVLDTRTGNGAPTAPVVAQSALTLQVAGRGGVPATGVGAVVLNVTVTNPRSYGFITAYPFATRPPNASNLNFVAQQTVPNLVVVKLSRDGKINLGNTSAGSVDLVADVAGYFIGGVPDQQGMFTPTNPTRLLDTRAGIGAPAAKVAAGGTLALRVSGTDGIPVGSMAGVVLNVTATNTVSSGFVTVYPSEAAAPTASNLNYGPQQTVPNLVVAKVGVDGRVLLRNNSAASVDLVADMAGFFLGEQILPRISSSTPIQGYNNTGDAAAGANITVVFAPGTYYVYKTESGMTNLTNTPGVPGVWVNPALFDKRPSAPDPSLTRYSNTQIDWSHEYPGDGQYAFPTLGGVYRYPDGKVHLTFDLGYEYKNLTTVVLNKLRAKGVHATFYVTGYYMQTQPALVRRMLAEGHVVSNHSMNHPNTVQLMAQGLQPAFDDFRAWEETYKGITGLYPDLWKYRPPSGIFSERVIAMAQSLGYLSELYDVALFDYDVNNQLSPSTTMSKLQQQTSGGSIVLLHTVSESNATVLDDYLDYCRSQGWHFAEP